MWVGGPWIVGATLLLNPGVVRAEGVEAVRPLVSVRTGDLHSALPPRSTLLHAPKEIERFLKAVEDGPPDWAAVYGSEGHAHDERLFELNRIRDRRRHGRPALRERITFLWPGELSDYDPAAAGFRLAVGPVMIATDWGLVRFKPEDVPSPMIAVPPPPLRELLRRQQAQQRRIEVTVAMTGRLVPEESLIYDFSHEEVGRGVIMPVVRIERVDYFLIQ